MDLEDPDEAYAALNAPGLYTFLRAHPTGMRVRKYVWERRDSLAGYCLIAFAWQFLESAIWLAAGDSPITHGTIALWLLLYPLAFALLPPLWLLSILAKLVYLLRAVMSIVIR
jgi:hypothetical protein